MIEKNKSNIVLINTKQIQKLFSNEVGKKSGNAVDTGTSLILR